jgi:hypothetical protein
MKRVAVLRFLKEGFAHTAALDLMIHQKRPPSCSWPRSPVEAFRDLDEGIPVAFR